MRSAAQGAARPTLGCRRPVAGTRPSIALIGYRIIEGNMKATTLLKHDQLGGQEALEGAARDRLSQPLWSASTLFPGRVS
jgi:hypothetical protein